MCMMSGQFILKCIWVNLNFTLIVLVPQITYLGCWFDDPERKLNVDVGFAEDRTIEGCVWTCNERGYMYSGVQVYKADTKIRIFRCYCIYDLQKRGYMHSAVQVYKADTRIRIFRCYCYISYKQILLYSGFTVYASRTKIRVSCSSGI